MAFYIVMVFVVIALAWIVGWALTDKDGHFREDDDDE